MALSRIVAIGDGATKQFSIPFALGYIKEDDIDCRVGNEVDGLGDPVYRSLTFLSPELVEVGGATPGNLVNVVFTRTVDREDLIVNYEDGDVINEENMNTAQRQAIMLVHEVLDGRFEQLQADLDMGGFLVTGLGTPVDPGDATNKAYVDSRISTGQASASAAAASAAAAAGSASAASSSAGTASTASSTAVAAKDTAVAAANSTSGSVSAAATSASNAATSATNAGNSETAAANSATSASGSATTATTKAGEAATSATNSGNSATASAGSASAAATSAGTASTAATNTANWRDLAQKWAENPEDVAVVTGQFSALHWAAKAQAWAVGTSPVQTQINAASSVAFVDADHLTARQATTGNLIKSTVSAFRSYLNSYFARLSSSNAYTGDQTINKTWPTMNFNKTTSGSSVQITGQTGGLMRWVFMLGNGTAEANTADGSDFVLDAYDNAGNWLSTPFSIFRATATVSGGIFATVTQYFNNTASKILTTDKVWDSGVAVALTDAATIVVNMSNFINATVTIAGNRTLGTPSNAKPGQTGRIIVKQDATGGRTLAFASGWVYSGGAPALSGVANSEDVIYYDVLTSGRVLITAIVKSVP